jgi:hypothetical protein
LEDQEPGGKEAKKQMVLFARQHAKYGGSEDEYSLYALQEIVSTASQA